MWKEFSVIRTDQTLIRWLLIGAMIGMAILMKLT
jgi:hypothetical protein